VVDRSRLQNRLQAPEESFHLPELLVPERHLGRRELKILLDLVKLQVHSRREVAGVVEADGVGR
jgi:hypothetical protein